MAAEGAQGGFPHVCHLQRQWGRDRMAAEGCPSRLGFWRRRSRQWGRDRMAAEGANVAQTRRRIVPASMGPRPDGRGRFDHRFKLLIDLTRQWGRDRMAAEGWVGGDDDCSFCRVNGAATGWPRKDVLWRHGPAKELLASMGPRPDGRGRLFGGSGANRQGVRQWGRDRMAAEGTDIVHLHYQQY